MHLLSIGEILWDLIDGTAHLGGAPFNIAVHAHRLGHHVAFVSAVGDDDRGRVALAQAAAQGVATDFIGTIPGVPTDTVTVTLDSTGQPAFTIHRPAAYDFIPPKPAAFDLDWICFGTLLQTGPSMRRVVQQLLDTHPSAGRFYDVNLRPACYTPELVADLLRQATVVKLNESEVEAVTRMTGTPAGSLEEFCRRWPAACVTRGAAGCAIFLDGQYCECPGYPVKVADTVGSGDAFSAAFLHGIAQCWPPRRIGDFANRVGALVASRSGATPPWSVAEAEAL